MLYKNEPNTHIGRFDKSGPTNKITISKKEAVKTAEN
jgi:hypothetical protein